MNKEDFIHLAMCQRIAIELHELDCKSNHTDACGWYYEFSNKEHEWGRLTHKRYLERVLLAPKQHKELVSLLRREKQLREEINKIIYKD